MSLPSTTDAAFADDVLSSETPVLVDFTAAWCGPCRMLAPVLEQIASDEAARLRVVSIDVDANPVTTLNYQVRSMPTLALFVAGEVVARFVGARPRTAIMRELEPHLGVPRSRRRVP
ncbi:MAG: thioredoxin 1 [Pseudonocardiales bacterium]|jgi:thioredoxin 1|nr:thioredoxin 1 [Pseudonocardiales bacterium]